MSIGYPDGQRVENYDGPLEYFLSNASEPGGAVSPIIDVSRYASVGGIVQVGTAQAEVVFTWYADPAAIVNLGSRSLILDPNIAAQGNYLIPNQGPFLQVRVLPLAGGDPIVSLAVMPSNRQRTLEFLPQFGVQIDQVNVALAASASDFFYPAEYCAGPVYVSGQATQPGNVILQILSSAGVWNNLAVFAQAANVPLIQSILVPFGAWRFAITNTNATAGTATIRVWQSATGSS